MNKIKNYANTSSWEGGAWCPSITGYDAEDNEYRYELDLTDSALVNWSGFKAKFPAAANRRVFFCEFHIAKAKTEDMSRRS